MRMPISVAVRLLPIDQLSSGVCMVMPSPYRSAMTRPFHVTTKAAVIDAAGSKAASTARLTLAMSSAASTGLRRQRIAHRPRQGRRVGEPARDLDGCEARRRLAHRQREASLIAQVNGGASHAVGQRDVHRPGGAIDHRLAEPGALLVRGGEVADVLGGEVGVESGDEHGGAHDLGEAGGVMFQRVARRRHVGRVELERLRPGDQSIVRAAQGGREIGRGRRGPHPREYTEVGDAAAPYTWSNSGLTGRARR